MRCKPGDLAIILVADLPEFIGLPVKVLCRGQTIKCNRYGIKETWVVEFTPAKRCTDGRLVTCIHHPDDFLMPIRGNSISKTEEEKDDLVVG